MNLKKMLIFPILLAICATCTSQVINNPFELQSGANIYFSLDDNNWIDETIYNYDFKPNEGMQAIASANGSGNVFQEIGLQKDLGGMIEDKSYEVSFYIGKYIPGLKGIEFDHFTELIIGGEDGVMTWDTVPTPTIDGEWVKWSGVYTPAISDLGKPFIFKAIFNLEPQHEIAIDGPIIVDSIGILANTLEANMEKQETNVYPNPFTDQVNIAINVKKRSLVKITVYNFMGQAIKTIHSDYLPASPHNFTWNGTNDLGIKVPGGLYSIAYKIDQKIFFDQIFFNRLN